MLDPDYKGLLKQATLHMEIFFSGITSNNTEYKTLKIYF